MIPPRFLTVIRRTTLPPSLSPLSSLNFNNRYIRTRPPVFSPNKEKYRISPGYVWFQKHLLLIKPEFWDFGDEPDIASDLRRIEIEKYHKMPPKGSSKRKRPSTSASAGTGANKENKEEVNLASLPKDSTPPPNFVMEQAHNYHVDHPHPSTSTSKTTDEQIDINLNPNPDANPEILDARSALRASPDADEVSDIKPGEKNTEEFELGRVVGAGEVGAGVKEDAVEPAVEAKREEQAAKEKVGGKRGRAANGGNAKKGPEVKVVDQAYPTNPTSGENDTIDVQVKRETTPLATVQNTNTTDNETETTPAKKGGKKPTKASVAAKKGADEIKAFVAAQAKVKKEPTTTTDEDAAGANAGDGDNGGDGPDGVTDDMDAREREAKRPPPVNSDYLPLPWKGRLGYACLNTYLRFSNPPVFASRTCRIQSILDHRYSLTNPDEPEHATKNRPDKTKTPSVERGMEYVQSIGLANAKDCVKMIRWNDKYGIRFMRLSSEMFPFASHEEYGYTLEGFAKEVLGEVGKVAAEVGCRLTTHPGQVSSGVSGRAVVERYKLIGIFVGGCRWVVYATRIAETTGHR